MSLIHGTPHGEGNVVALTTLNSGAAAARRYTIVGSTGKVHAHNAGTVPLYYSHDADISAAGGHGIVGAGESRDIDIGAAAFLSLWCTADANVVSLGEVS